MSYTHQAFPSWRYGPNGAAVIVNSEDETPKGFSAERDKGAANEGTKTAVAPTNGTTSAEKASKTTSAVSRASVDVGKAANAGVGGTGQQPAATTKPKADESKGADPSTIELDADGHAYDPSLHAGTGSKTKAGLWRMKVGVARPNPAKGYPKPAPLDL